MSMRWSRVVSVCVASLSLSLACPASGMDLVQVYQAALVQDATVRAARATAESGREVLVQATAQLYPSLSFSAARNYNNLSRTQPNFLGQNVSVQESYLSDNQSLTLRQPLYRKGLISGVEQAGYLVDDTNAALERELQNLGVRVAGVYMEALLAQDQLSLVQAQKKTTTIQLDAARRTFQAGAGIRTDIDESQARLDLLIAQELEALQQLDFTRRQLEALTNQPTGELAPLDAQAMPLLAPTPASLAQWIELAEAKSPELAAFKARIGVARMVLEKARSGHYPTLDAVAQVVRSASENVTTPSSSYVNRSLGLQLNIPLYAGGYVSSAVRQALAEQTRAQELQEAARRDLGLRVHREFRGVTEGVLRIRAREQAVRSADQLVLSSQRSLQAGTRTRLDILNAEDKKQIAQRDLAQTRYEYLMSRIRLQALAGGDNMQSLLEVNTWLKAQP